ncbi:type IV secretion system DNA-binding domain-containing protein [Methylophilus methylotrophus]|uniref:type IV secretion system DNA-binding domain-containing protein n=1 Tax=Methylophilus methylotrophus TaxID=17 RepID=UPI0003770086|nr:type IV secretion system DNA-binding domain-containing protein [Methylophilus methylotrophus]
MKIRYISSPKQDAFLAPSEFRRYTNHIIVFNIVLFSAVFFSLTYLFFNKYLGLDFIKQFKLFLNKDYEYMKINSVLFQFTILFFFIPSCLVSHFLTNQFTKAQNRQVIKAGNIVDDTEEVLTNLSKNFAHKSTDQTIAFLRAGELDLNSHKYKPLKKTIYLPKPVLELSTVITGEAGSGKTLYTDRLLKEVIDNDHKAIVHNVKGDELEKLDGYTSLYLIEPWNKKAGYAIDFLNLVASDELENENSRIRTFVMAFTEGANKKDFFDVGSISVIDSFVRSVVRTTKENGVVKGTLGDIVKQWNSFNIQPVDINTVTSDDLSKLKEELKKNQGQLDEINKFITKYNPTASIYINSENAKTSLCVLASCIEIIRKFETLSSFWNKKEKEKSLNIREWIANKKDRQVIMLSNSNKYSDIANSYIGAFINLIVPELIDNSYKPTSQIHFILDEFPQLSSIDLDNFMKLPDVGRSKNIRTTVILQRSSQIKEKFQSNNKPADHKSFMASFQNKIVCRFASDEVEYIKELIGEQDIIEYSTTTNFTAQGQTFSNKTTEKKQPAYNINELNNILGPQTDKNLNFIGVRVLFKYSQDKVMPVVIMPPVKFPKKFKPSFKSSSSAASSKPINKINSALEDKQQEIITTNQEIVINESIVTTHLEPSKTEIDTNPLEGAIKEVIAHSIDTTGALATINLAGDIVENLTTESKNNNITEIDEIRSLLTKNKNKKELEI